MKKEINSGRRATTWPVFGSILFLCILGFQRPVVGQVTFTPITEGALVEESGDFLGIGLVDYDNDGDVDVTVGSQAVGATQLFFRNNGDGTFEKITEGILSSDPISPGGGSWADQDNDGDLDLYLSAFHHQANAFYRNDGVDGFVKVTEGEWVNTAGDWNAAAWGDYDGDGFVDLYVTNDDTANRLYHNNGDGTMTKVVSPASGFTGGSRGVRFSDYDGDGDVDLFVAGHGSQVQYRNDGSGIFTWISAGNGGIPGYNLYVDVGLFSADYDNDGDIDMFFSTWDVDPMDMLYRNDGASGFVKATDVLPSVGKIDGMIAAWGDYDNDGFQDLFVADHLETGGNLLYHNEGDGSFSLVAESPVAGSKSASAAGAWWDYDNDGDLDLIVSNGFESDTPQPCELFRNDGGTNHWISINLIGTDSNRSAIGAKAWVTATIDGSEITQLREVYGAGMPEHFGLGDAETISNLTIEWPSGAVQVMKDVSADQFLTVTEMNMGGKLANISTRGQVGTGDSVLIAGLVITGATPQTVLIRASGSTLSDFGVSDVLADTILGVFDAEGNIIAFNIVWGDATNADEIEAATTRVGAFPFPADSSDSAILITLDPGAYTARVQGADGATGNALVEVYGVD